MGHFDTILYRSHLIRPEKLAYYKQADIPDIRWYGLNDGVLYSNGNVVPIERRVNYVFEPSVENKWRAVYLENVEPTWALCLTTYRFMEQLADEVRELSTRREKLRHISKVLVQDENSRIGDHFEFFASRCEFADVIIEWDNEYKKGGLKYSDGSERAQDRLHFDVLNTLWSDGHGAVITQYCDVCGSGAVDTVDESVESVWSSAHNMFSSYETFLSHSFRQERDSLRRGRSPIDAAAAYEQNAVDLVQHLEDFTDNVLLLFESARSMFENIWS